MVEANEKLVQAVEDYRISHNIEIKCISDRILLYLRWGSDKIFLTNEGREFAMELYSKVRGELNYTSKNPRSVAAAILFISTIKAKMLIPSYVIALMYDISVNTLRKMCRDIGADFKINIQEGYYIGDFASKSPYYIRKNTLVNGFRVKK